MKLLFTCGHWHGLAKLQLHINNTLDLLDVETEHIGKELGSFISKTCTFYNIWELKWEADAQKWQKVRKDTCEGTSVNHLPLEVDSMMETDEPTMKKLNINTYKAHLLGDYARTICWLGTTNSYSTGIVSTGWYSQYLCLHNHLQGELKHCHPKAHFSPTDKKGFIKQMTRIEHREMCIHHIWAELCILMKAKKSYTTGKALRDCYYIGKSENTYQHVGIFLQNTAGDPTVNMSVIHPAAGIHAELMHRVIYWTSRNILQNEYCPTSQAIRALVPMRLRWLWVWYSSSMIISTNIEFSGFITQHMTSTVLRM